MTTGSKILTRRLLLKRIKRKKIRTWFDLGIFLDKLQQRRISFAQKPKDFQRFPSFSKFLSNGSFAFITYGLGVRGVELGTSCFGEIDQKTGKLILPKLDLLRLTIPRRVYTDNHMGYVAESIIKIYRRRKKVKGLKRVYAPALLGHFLAKFDRL